MALWPTFEFRPLPSVMQRIVLRYADGNWALDDGEYDLAFVTYGSGAPLALYVELPYQRNIIWSGLTTHWSCYEPAHPRGNPWHYMLRDGETKWGGDWNRDSHPNRRAGDRAINHCSKLNRCANGQGPSFEHGDPYIAAGLVRNATTKEIVKPPELLTCMYCGDAWDAKARGEQVSA